MKRNVELRAVGDDDEPFLFDVFRSVREPELVQTGWSNREKLEFLVMQFNAQRRHYERHYLGAEHSVVLVDDEPAGRLYVARWESEIRIVDIALLPPFRGRGIGTHLLRQLIDEGDRTGRPVSIHVEKFNPALRLYERLGFEPVADREVYLLMERRPVKPAQAPTS